jgi:DMSO/TMAO reductase YedYZ molybdopterin-dependent catalytic subunit
MRRALRGALVGAVGGIAAVLMLAVLRDAAGAPLPVESVSDRLLPLVPVDRFLQLLGLMGGPIAAKELAYAGGFAAPVLLGAAAGALLIGKRGGVAKLTAALVAVWVALVAALWPALGANYAGRGGAPASAAGAGALLAAVATYLLFAAAAGPAPRREPGPAPAAGGSRRSFLVAGAGALLALATGLEAASLFRRGAFAYDGSVLRGPVEPVTPNHEFYVVTKNLIDPDVDPDAWRLTVAGAVRRPFELSLADLAGLPATDIEATLECISNGVGYGLLSNAVWSGVPMGDLLARAEPRPGASFVGVRAADGYTYGLPLDHAMRPSTMVVHRMNGEPLPRQHGFPVRAIVPGRYGEASVKWLSAIEVTDRPVVGYYESQGWRSDFVQTTSRIDWPPGGGAVSRSVGPVLLRGVAFAGDRGVQAVEVSTDGSAWDRAEVTRSSGRFAWVLWSLAWTPPRPGSYLVRVRATDGRGVPQDASRRGFAPSGATGYHERQVEVVA